MVMCGRREGERELSSQYTDEGETKHIFRRSEALKYPSEEKPSIWTGERAREENKNVSCPLVRSTRASARGKNILMPFRRNEVERREKDIFFCSELELKIGNALLFLQGEVWARFVWEARKLSSSSNFSFGFPWFIPDCILPIKILKSGSSNQDGWIKKIFNEWRNERFR